MSIIINKETILNYLKEHKSEFEDKYQIEKIGLFGSYAKGRQTIDSDIDIIVDMPASFKNYYALKNSLEAYFDKKVDLGMSDTIRAFVKKEIQKDVVYV